jgi:flavodoxin
MAEIVRTALKNADIEVQVKDMAQADVQDLTADHDLLLPECPAYGDDSIELQEDFGGFYKKMDGVKLNGEKFAVLLTATAHTSIFSVPSICWNIQY